MSKLEICRRDYNFMYDLQQAGEIEIKDLKQKNEALQERVDKLETVISRIDDLYDDVSNDEMDRDFGVAGILRELAEENKG